MLQAPFLLAVQVNQFTFCWNKFDKLCDVDKEGNIKVNWQISQ